MAVLKIEYVGVILMPTNNQVIIGKSVSAKSVEHVR